MTLINLIEAGSLRLFSKTIYISEFQTQSRKDGNFGNSDDKTSTIGICADLPYETKEETLLHEVIHHIEANLMLKMTEEQVMGLSVGLYDFLKSNQLIL